jgi:hypothetical protein
MIGVIGPADSVELALTIAREEGLGDAVVGRSYESLDESPRSPESSIRSARSSSSRVVLPS